MDHIIPFILANSKKKIIMKPKFLPSVKEFEVFFRISYSYRIVIRIFLVFLEGYLYFSIAIKIYPLNPGKKK